MIQEGLTIPTYVLTIRKEGDKSFVDITRNGEKFMDSMKLASKEDIEKITPLQIASIVIESILFLAQAIGIHVALSAGTLQRLANQVGQAVQRSAVLLSAVAKLRIAMQGGSRFAQARGVFGVITASYSAGVLWTVMKGAFTNMSYWDWMMTAAQMVAAIAASISTDGAVLVAQIAIALASATVFINKFRNLTEFEEMSKNF